MVHNVHAVYAHVDHVLFSSVVAAEAEEMAAAVPIGNRVCEAVSAAAHISASG